MSGRCVVRSAALRGVEAVPVDVEVAVTSGLPAFNIVGMADAAVQESRERIRVALKAAGFTMPPERVLVNLAPSSLRKTGSGFDLPIAVGILAATGQVNPEVVRDALFVGELSLAGRVRPVSGMLAFAICARDEGCALACSDRGGGLMPIADLKAWGMHAISDLRTGEIHDIAPCAFDGFSESLDYAEVSGNELGKRAFQIAAAGSHGVIMMGPPGSGKTMLATRVPSILPPLEQDEMLEAALVHSVAGLEIGSILAGNRPFRSPHHSATSAGLLGGGSPVHPGEISLAHRGVLFLDELPEFRTSVLQQIRQPMEEGKVSISRAEGVVVFPARFMLVAAANPCRCGHYGDPEHACTCTDVQVREYQNRIGGPLLDRIDMHVDVNRVPPSHVMSGRGGTSSEKLREGVVRGRLFASWRKSIEVFPGTTQGLIASCHLSDADRSFVEHAAQANAMSGRSIAKTLSLARTIADIDERLEVNRDDLCEALSLRVRREGGM